MVLPSVLMVLACQARNVAKVGEGRRGIPSQSFGVMNRRNSCDSSPAYPQSGDWEWRSSRLQSVPLRSSILSGYPFARRHLCSVNTIRGEACETSRYEYRAMKDGEILSRLQDEVERVLAPSSPARPPSRRARTEVATRRARSRGRSTAAAEAADRVKAAERCAARRGAGIERQRENERASSLRLLRMEDDGSSDRNSKCDFRVEKLFQNENDVTASVRTYLHES